MIALLGKLIPPPYRILAICLAAAALFAAGGTLGWRAKAALVERGELKKLRHEFADYREGTEAAMAIAAGKMQRDGEADRELAANLEMAESEVERLRRAAALVPATVETKDANGIPHLAINPVWWLCNSALLSGDTADTASCEAKSGSAGLQPGAGAPRLQVSTGVREPH